MADRLTQLQDCIDDLLTQMYASISYIQTRHPYGSIADQPSQAPAPNSDDAQTPPPPSSPRAFDAALRELARDLVLKEQQIEYLITSLPGLGSSEAEQEKRMREVQAELGEVEAERAAAEREREELVAGLGAVVVGVRRVV